MLYRVTFKELIESSRSLEIDATNMTEACEKLAKLVTPTTKEFRIISIDKEPMDLQSQADITMGIK
jgi:hypothetical protein